MRLESRKQGEALDAEGRVYCPVRAISIDHELCFGCSYLGAIDTCEEGAVASVRCAPPLMFRRIPPV